MRQLANEGLIEIYPNRFAEVKQYTEREMRRRMRDVEDRNTILTAQVEGLLKAQ